MVSLIYHAHNPTVPPAFDNFICLLGSPTTATTYGTALPTIGGQHSLFPHMNADMVFPLRAHHRIVTLATSCVPSQYAERPCMQIPIRSSILACESAKTRGPALLLHHSPRHSPSLAPGPHPQCRRSWTRSTRYAVTQTQSAWRRAHWRLRQVERIQDRLHGLSRVCHRSPV